MHDRKTHWKNVYGEKSSLEVSWFKKQPRLSLQLIKNAQLSQNDPIIDIGGGASTLVDYLSDGGYKNISVLDISGKALACTKTRLGDKSAEIKWFEDDITLFKPPHQFSLWHDRAVFHFLTDKADRNSYINILKKALEENGHLIIAAFYIGGPTKCSGLDIVQYDAEKLLSELGDGFKLIEQANETHMTPANKEQKFGYFHFIKQ